MIHPLFRLIATRPHLLADHLEAYAELVVVEATRAAATLKRGLLLQATALCCMAMAAVLGGVALMLWAVVPPSEIHAPWALLVAPGLPLLVALACLLWARRGVARGALAELGAQVRADMAMFREASAA